MTRCFYRFESGMNTTMQLPFPDNTNVITKRQRLRLLRVGLRDHTLTPENII